MSTRSSNTDTLIDIEQIRSEAARVNTGVTTIDENQTRDLGGRIRTRSFMENGDGDPSSSDKVEVITSSSSNPISTQTQQQEPTVPGEEEMTAPYIFPAPFDNTRFEKQDLRVHANNNVWRVAKSILDRYPEFVRIPLDDDNSTALHIAVNANSTDFVRELVNYEHVTAKDLEILDAKGNTAFCLAAITGKCELIEIMIQKNKDLPLIHGRDRMLPSHWALLNGFHRTAEKLCSFELLFKMAYPDFQQLFLLAINRNLYDLVKRLFMFDTKNLALARDDKEKTALHIMALKSFDFDISTPQGDIIRVLWAEGKKLEYSERMKLITTPSVLVFDAIKLGNIGFIIAVYEMELKPWELKDPATGQNILHIAVLFRQHKILDLILQKEEENSIMRQAVDKDGNNALHYVAHQIQEVSTTLRPDLQIKKEVTWFKDMKEKLGSRLSEMTNKDGKTPSDMFHVHHRKLSDDAKDTANGVANTCMVVAALIVAIAFAAALTTPGDKSSVWFTVFIMANGAALFTSTLSIVAFLSIFTSPTFKESDFVTSLYPSLTIGKVLLFISLIGMIIAFSAASFLIFDHEHKWVAYAVSSLGLLTIIYILQLQLSLFGRLHFFKKYKRCLKSIKGMFGFQTESGSVSRKEA